MLGIETEQRVFYEGGGFVGTPVSPAPLVTVATILARPEDYAHIPADSALMSAPLVFREDHFDPVTRVRRGRFYSSGGSQPMQWSVHAHPLLALESRYQNPNYPLLRKQLFTFNDWPARLHLAKGNPRPLAALGTQQAMTLWRVVGIEQISTGEDLVTLKAQSNLGVVPALAEDALPQGAVEHVSPSLERLVDTVYRAGPESVIDRCRDLAASSLGFYFEKMHPGASHKDLGDLANLAGAAEQRLIEWSARMIARLHARAKPNEQLKRGTQPPTEEDASLALECTSLILRELGWAVQ